MRRYGTEVSFSSPNVDNVSKTFKPDLSFGKKKEAIDLFCPAALSLRDPNPTLTLKPFYRPCYTCIFANSSSYAYNPIPSPLLHVRALGEGLRLV
jgi:hypothetical protein